MNDIADIIRHEIVLRGIGGSPGICIGKAYLVDREGVNVVKRYYLQPAQITTEINRFKAAVKHCGDELQAIIAAAPQDTHRQAGILESHLVLLKDKMLYGRTLDTIKNDRLNAEWALKKVVFKLKTMFQTMADDYLRERATDIEHVAERVMRNLLGAESVDIGSITKRVILVARDLSPGETSQIQLERVKGFITDKGGKASHTSIIARSLEIPAVLGLENATQVIENNDLLVVDGSAGIVILNPTDRALVAYEELRIKYERKLAVMTRRGRAPAKTRDGFHMKVMGNIELPEEVVSVIDHGGDGIGLYRTEFQYLGRPTFPTEKELFDRYRDVVEVIAPKSITIRTLDINGDKAMAFSDESDEANPALGLRAIRYCLKKPEIFKTQLRAILRAAAHGDVRVMFPMISGLEEVLAAKRLLDEAAQSLEREKNGLQPRHSHRHHDRGALGGGDCRSFGRRGRFFQRGHQRSDSIRPGHRPRQPPRGPLVSRPASGRAANDQAGGRCFAAKGHRALHVWRDGRRSLQRSGTAGTGDGRVEHEPPSDPGCQEHGPAVGSQSV